ncbi:uncharacterized protein LOC101239119 [Hydra vulgaris]|uniref:Uncharacterized protein LOC101239119 n=1 Tax=Hydra vulgaris TaxID=6087 RepID=A0ABM4CP80_HYDVU
MIGVHVIVLAVVVSMHNCLKLSDLPVLKKWEIPSHHISKHIGRKFKDLENLDTKRSHHWELQPDFTSNEVDWYEDPEKVKLDFNYKSFLDEEESSLKSEASIPHSKQIANNGVKRYNIARNPETYKTANFARFVINSKLHNNTLKEENFENKKHRQRRSNQDFKIVLSTDNYHHDDNVIYEKETKSNAESLYDREKRDIISDFLNKQRNSKANGKVQVNKKKDPVVKDSNKHASALENKESLEKKNAELKIKKSKDGVLGDEQIVKNTKPITLRPENSKTTKTHKNSMLQLQDVKATTREKIDHPKEKLNMDTVPANVARAVAMAMEQLKRDKMWGKVFVHVRPSGQLKVMVQETTKMDDDTNKK